VYCRVCTASVDGQLCVWDSDSVLQLYRVQLDIDDKSLSSLRHHRDKFLCCMLTFVFFCIVLVCKKLMPRDHQFTVVVVIAATAAAVVGLA